MPPKRKAEATESTTTAKAAKKTKVAIDKAATKPAPSAKSAPKAVAADAAATKTVDATQTNVPPTADSATASTKSSVTPPIEPVYAGKFDWYSTLLPFLHREYLPAGTRKPRYAELYATILKYQAKPDFSGRFALAESGVTGAFACKSIVNPISDETLEDPIYVLLGKCATITLGRKEMPKGQESAAATFEHGYRCDLEMDVGASGDCGAGMISKVKGGLKLHRVWHDGDKELFEGYVDVTVVHGATLRRKGFGGTSGVSTPIWAVRARRDGEGQEIGIDEGDGAYFGGGGGDDDFDLDDAEDEDYYGGGRRYGSDDEDDYY